MDNYISLVGLQRDGAVNGCLLAPTVGFDWSSPVNGLTFAHSYAHLFYRNTVWPSGPVPAVGFGKSYEGGSAFPPSGTGLSAGSLWYEYLATSDALDAASDTLNSIEPDSQFAGPVAAPDGSPVSTDMIDISAHAGQTVELFFGLVGGTSTKCAVAVDGVRFIIIPQPKVGLALNGPNIAVKWPAAAVGWVLETSDTLAPVSWQAVPMTGVAVDKGVATIEQPIGESRRFYRLRRVQ